MAFETKPEGNLSRVIIFSSCRRVYSIPHDRSPKKRYYFKCWVSILILGFNSIIFIINHQDGIRGSIKCVDGWHPAISIIMIVIATIFLHCMTSFFSETELPELVVRGHMMFEQGLELLL